MEKKNIKIKFVDMGGHIDTDKNFFTEILEKRYNIILSDDPDYVFFGAYGFEHLKYNCIRIMWTIENYVPDFNISDYAVGYEIMEFGDRYVRFPFYLVPPYINNLKKAINRNNINIPEKKDFCSFVVSNMWGDNYRVKLFQELSKYKKVDSGGKVLNNIGGPIGGGLDKKFNFDETHKFSFALENASNPGYTTEKITDAFGANCIPIYWGNPKIEEEFNAKAFINCNDLTIEEAVAKIIEIDNDNEAYENMLKEKVFLKTIEDFYYELEKFLFNIFDQPLDKAYRRDKFMKGKQQEHVYQLMSKYYYKPYYALVKIATKLHLENFGKKIFHKIRDK